MSESRTKILIANNSLAAIKFIISLSSRDIIFVGMATHHDLQSNQLYINYLDHYLVIENYDVEEILRAAVYFEPDFVWPGWGHSSENYLLPKRLKENGFCFMGPDENAMRLLGDKIMSNKLAGENGIPCIPYTTDINSFVGFFRIYGTALIKSSNLGGGKGIEIIETEDQLMNILVRCKVSEEISRQSSSSEIAVETTTMDGLSRVETRNKNGNIPACSNFVNEGVVTNSTLAEESIDVKITSNMTSDCKETEPGIFMTKIVKDARHVEIQILRDNFGNTIVLGTRDCTMQRRHQKIIEEGPAILPKKFYQDMKVCAKKLLIVSGYVGVATVEFLVTKEDFYFLEVNTRIQVEHPVTELNAQVNIPELQLDIAMNKNLSWLRESTSKNHVMAARITAEDNNFNLQTGNVNVSFLPSRNTLIYFSVLNGKITEQNDSQFGHVFAYGVDRNEAIRNLISALGNIRITGIDSPIPRIVDILRSKFFVENSYYIDTLEKLAFQNNELMDIAYFSAAYFLISRNSQVSFAYNNDCFFTRCHMVSDGEMLIEMNNTFYKVGVAGCCEQYSGKQTSQHDKSFTETFTLNDTLITLSVISQDTYRMLNRKSNTFTLLTQNITAPCNGRIVEIRDGYIEKDDVVFIIESMKTRIHVRSKDNLRYSKLKNEGSIVSVGDNVLKIVSHKITCNTAIKFEENYTSHDLMRWTEDLRALPPSLYTFPEDERIIQFLHTHFNVAMGIIKKLGVNAKQCERIKDVLEKVLVEKGLDNNVVRFYLDIKDLYRRIEKSKSREECLGSNITGECFTGVEQTKIMTNGGGINSYELNTGCAKPFQNGNEQGLGNKAVITSWKEGSFSLSGIHSDAEEIRMENYSAFAFTYEYFNGKFCACPKIDCECLGTGDKSVMIHAKELTNELMIFIKLFPKQKYALCVETDTNIERAKRFFEKVVCGEKVYLKVRGYGEMFVYKDGKIGEYYLDGLKVDIPKDTNFKIRYEGFLYLMYVYLCTKKIPMCYKEVFMTVSDGMCPINENREAEQDNKAVDQAIRLNNTDSKVNKTHNVDEKDSYKAKGNVKERVGCSMGDEEENKCFTGKKKKSTEIEKVLSMPSETDINKFTSENHMLSFERKIRIGLLAYIFTINGENILFVINDKKFKSGSFSYNELIFFNLINLLCIENKFARIHFSDNSGARIGIDEAVKNRLVVKEGDDGLMLYLREDGIGDTRNVENGIAKGKNERAKQENYNEEVNHKKKDQMQRLRYIKGNDDSGPENLPYSSLSSISTIEAFNRTFTLSFITNHSVGIGAYLAVLGKRIIMKRGSVMLLTGYKALNKLNQNDIYNSNEELGGVDIMCENNVCQKEVQNEYEGVCEVFKWLKFWMEGKKFHRNKKKISASASDEMRNDKTSNHNPRKNENSVANNRKHYDEKRESTVSNEKNPSNTANDQAIVTAFTLNCREVTEIISHSIIEYSNAFSSNIKTVRCFVKDISVGIIYACENGTCVLDAESSEKFSTFIEQINKENINLIILANFKGFSGGDMDMKRGILKQGSKIIENLKAFTDKIFVYIGSGWQVRGGTFVILDKFINKRIRVFASSNSRIGILQPDGLSEVKFKEKERVKILKENGLIVNEKNLNELAVKFCELHDHPERMVCKDRIDGILEIGELEDEIYEYFSK